MIYTVTLNPSLDVTLWLSQLNAVEPVSVGREQIDPAGKAVNVSRVLTRLGVENKLYGFCGSGNGERLRMLLQEYNVGFELLEVPGFVRENLSLVLENGTLYKVDRAGFSVPLERLGELEVLLQEATAGDSNPLIVFSGSLSPGMPKEAYYQLILPLRERGARIVLDNDFFTWEEIRSLSPFLIKPNEMEFRRLVCREFRSAEEMLDCAGGLVDRVSHVLVSLGAAGLLYAGGERRLQADVPAVKVKSCVGAGDSTVAGFLAAMESGSSLEDCVRFAAACGTAAVLTEGTGVLSPEQARAFLSEIPITEKTG